jgi:hypothetical protein
MIETHQHKGDFKEWLAQLLFATQNNTRFSSAIPAMFLNLTNRMKVTRGGPE